MYLYLPRQSNIAQPRIAARCARLSRPANQHSHGLYWYSNYSVSTIIIPNLNDSGLTYSTLADRFFEFLLLQAKSTLTFLFGRLEANRSLFQSTAFLSFSRPSPARASRPRSIPTSRSPRRLRAKFRISNCTNSKRLGNQIRYSIIDHNVCLLSSGVATSNRFHGFTLTMPTSLFADRRGEQ